MILIVNLTLSFRLFYLSLTIRRDDGVFIIIYIVKELYFLLALARIFLILHSSLREPFLLAILNSTLFFFIRYSRCLFNFFSDLQNCFTEWYFLPILTPISLLVKSSWCLKPKHCSPLRVLTPPPPLSLGNGRRRDKVSSSYKWTKEGRRHTGHKVQTAITKYNKPYGNPHILTSTFVYERPPCTF